MGGGEREREGAENSVYEDALLCPSSLIEIGSRSQICYSLSHSKLVSNCFEPSPPLGIISGLIKSQKREEPRSIIIEV